MNLFICGHIDFQFNIHHIVFYFTFILYIIVLVTLYHLMSYIQNQACEGNSIIVQLTLNRITMNGKSVQVSFLLIAVLCKSTFVFIFIGARHLFYDLVDKHQFLFTGPVHVSCSEYSSGVSF